MWRLLRYWLVLCFIVDFKYMANLLVWNEIGLHNKLHIWDLYCFLYRFRVSLCSIIISNGFKVSLVGRLCPLRIPLLFHMYFIRFLSVSLTSSCFGLHNAAHSQYSPIASHVECLRSISSIYWGHIHNVQFYKEYLCTIFFLLFVVCFGVWEIYFNWELPFYFWILLLIPCYIFRFFVTLLPR